MDTITIRADASPVMGTGHIMRCLALAQWAKKLNISCVLMGRFQVPWIQARLASENIDYIALSDDIPKEEDPKTLMQNIAMVPQDSWIVLDGYHFNLKCQKAVREAGYKLLVIDDYAHLPEYSCDILLNQNIGAEKLTYKGDIGKLCLGLEYVLLRQEFIQARTLAEKRIYPDTPQNILLTLGGGDFLQYLQQIAPYFSIAEMTGRSLQIIAGAMQEDRIKLILKDCPARIEILYNVRDMPSLLLNTDLCISAGGSTCWELLCLGVPFLTVEVAENQHMIVNFLAEAGISKNILNFQTQKFGKLLKDEGEFHTGILNALKVNGEGGKKIISHIQDEKILANLNLRQIQMRDVDFILEIANDPLTRAMSFRQESISYNEHTSWFTKQISNNYPFYMAYYANAPCAYVRFAIENSQHIISIAMHKQFRRRGLGKHVLQKACAKYFFETRAESVCAYIKRINTASLHTFKSVGFLEIPYAHEDTVLMKLQR